MDYELLYPSGHRQRWEEEVVGDTVVYRCTTFSAAGDSLEFRLTSRDQLDRTLRRVLKSGGTVRQRPDSSSDWGPCPDSFR